MLILRECGHKGEVEELSQETAVGSLSNFSLVPSLTSAVLFRISTCLAGFLILNISTQALYMEILLKLITFSIRLMSQGEGS